jgi:hypothetical protein
MTFCTRSVATRMPLSHADDVFQAAQKDLQAECGEYMDTWVVSRNPIGVYKPPHPDPATPEVYNSLMIRNCNN